MSLYLNLPETAVFQSHCSLLHSYQYHTNITYLLIYSVLSLKCYSSNHILGKMHSGFKLHFNCDYFHVLSGHLHIFF